MLRRRTVVPHRTPGADNPEDIRALAGLYCLRPGEEATVCGGVERRAGAVEGGLRDGVCASVESELDDAASGDGYVVGLHLELGLADGDDGYAGGGGGPRLHGSGGASPGAGAGARGRGGCIAAAVAVAGGGGS